MPRARSTIRTIFFAGVVLLVLRAWISGSSSKSTATLPAPTIEPAASVAKRLDLTQPTYTTHYALICPLSLLFDRREDHGYEAVLGAYLSVFSRASKAKELGCEEWQSGIRVYATPLTLDGSDSGFISVRTHPGGTEGLITMPSELRNEETPPISIDRSVVLPKSPEVVDPGPSRAH